MIKMEKNSLMETLVMPLYGRAVCSRKYPDIFKDASAEEIIEKIDFDFSQLKYAEINNVTWAIRRQFMCERARAYLKKRPNATIVNLGCGVDESFSLVDNGSCHFINLDLPEVIAAREQLVALREREKNVAMNAFDLKWFDEVDTKAEDGLFIISGGMLMYFTAEQLKPLFVALAERFPKGGICFDAVNQKGLVKSNKIIRKSGNTDSTVVLAVEEADAFFSPWTEKFQQVSAFTTLPENIKNEKRISFLTRLMLQVGFKKGFIKFVEIIFV